MSSLLSSLAAALLLVNLVALGASRIGTVVRAVAVQGVLLGLLAVATQTTVEWRMLALAGASALLKGWLIPVIRPIWSSFMPCSTIGGRSSGR